MGETAQEIADQSILSQDERRDIVKSFVNAYLRGSVQITIWQGGGKPIWISSGKPIEPMEIVEMKKNFTELVDVVCGSVKPSNISFESAIDGLFRIMMILRSGEFIRGEFIQVPGLEAKVAYLEERVTSIEKLFEELQQRLKVRGPP